MSLLDRLRDGAARLASSASSAAQVAQLNVEIESLRAAMDKELVQAGRIGVQLVQSRLVNDAGLKEIAARIEPMASRMKELEAEKRAIQSAGEGPVEAEPRVATQQVVEGPACPACGAGVSMEHRFCKGCGVRLTWCTACQTVTAAAARFCSNCGAALDAGGG